MADKELRRLKRRDLLQMLLAQCEETERLQEELKGKTEELEKLQEGYDRLKNKLDIKDERLNQKDAKIMELKNSIEEMKLSRTIDLNEAGSIAEASLKLSGIFEAAQQAAEQYLMNVKRISGNAPELTKEKIKPDQMKEPECIEISEQKEDPTPAAYENYIGKVMLTVPYMGKLLTVMTSFYGKIAAACVVLLGAVLSFIGKR